MPIMEKALVRMENIHKWFGKVHALKGVNIKIWPGEIVGLVGDNGAGKSTLIKILAGVMRKDKGEIYWNEKKVDIPSVDDSRKLGIETLFQEQSIIGILSVMRNIFLLIQIVIHIRKLRKKYMYMHKCLPIHMKMRMKHLYYQVMSNW